MYAFGFCYHSVMVMKFGRDFLGKLRGGSPQEHKEGKKTPLTPDEKAEARESIWNDTQQLKDAYEGYKDQHPDVKLIDDLPYIDDEVGLLMAYMKRKDSDTPTKEDRDTVYFTQASRILQGLADMLKGGLMYQEDYSRIVKQIHAATRMLKELGALPDDEGSGDGGSSD